MKLLFAPSTRRIVPYPPVALGVLTAALRTAGVDVQTRDLEIEAAVGPQPGRLKSLLAAVTPVDLLAERLEPPAAELVDHLEAVLGLEPGESVAVSVMGFEQLAAAFAAVRAALRLGGAAILGGQFWTPASALDTVRALAPFGPAHVTVGDGWQAIADFAADPRAADGLANTYSRDSAAPAPDGPRGRMALPPEPCYDWCDWSAYERYGMAVYRDGVPRRRAHLYVWDKICNFRCAFCRVASGSRARLLPDVNVSSPFKDLLGFGVTQLNVMTNEINPSLSYMRRFLGALQESLDGAPPSWFTYVRADEVAGRDFALMRSVGGRLARFGVESGSQPLLDLMRKDYDVETMSATLRACAAADIWTHINLLVGFPGETEQDVDRTMEFLSRNAASIHSVRINPFYLPPDTPMARKPEEFGLRLKGFEKGWWDFEHLDGQQRDDGTVTDRLQRISRHCEDLGIGFAGADPFFLIDRIDRAGTVPEAMATLRDEIPQFWVAAPTDVYKGLVGGYEAATKTWESTVNKRQRNYSLTICTD